MLRRKRRVIILTTAAPELEFYNGRFLAIETHVGSSDLGSHFFWLIKNSVIWIISKSKYWKLRLNNIILKSLLIKIEFLLPFSGSRNALKITLIVTFSFPDTYVCKKPQLNSFILEIYNRFLMTLKATPIFDRAHPITINVTFSLPEYVISMQRIS